jgi:disulfide bond formation protein DsbB
MTLTTTRRFAGFILAASMIVLGTALASQYWGGLAPCELCLLQRWPWKAAVVIALVAAVIGNRPALPWIALLLALVYAVSASFAFYHLGVEQHWFAGPSACTTSSTGAATLEALERQLEGTQAVMCDKVQWSLFGVSLAGWNLLASLAMLAICGFVFADARRRRRRSQSAAAAPA